MEKSKEFVVDKTEDLKDSAQDFTMQTGGKIKEKTAGLRDAILETSEDIVEKGKETWKDISTKVSESEIVKKAADITEDVGDKVLDAGEDFMEKAKDVTEKVGKKVLDTGGDLMDKAKDVSEDLGEKVMEAKDEIVKKARDLTKDLGEKLDDTIEKAQKMAEEEAATPKKEFADDTLDTGESLLSGQDDFFSKAARYAEGDYGAMSEGKTKIVMTEQVKKEDPPSRIAGFEDLDGDGNELIDDAIISEEE